MSSLLRKLVVRYLAKRNKVPIEIKELEDLRTAAEKARAEMVEQGNVTGFNAGLERLKKRNIEIGTVFDVGASDGRAISNLLPFYRNAHFLCIEAEARHEPGLKRLQGKIPNFKYKIAAAGCQGGEVFFGGEEGDLFSGKASLEGSAGSRRVPMTTLDLEAAEHRLPGPYLIKLDTHGFEISILKGAQNVLKQTEVLIIEAYNIRFDPQCPLFYELCLYLHERGFACADFLEPQFRPADLMLWQMDLIFLKATRPEYRNLIYH